MKTANDYLVFVFTTIVTIGYTICAVDGAESKIPIPFVVWHGFGSCAVEEIYPIRWIRQNFSRAYVVPVKIGKDCHEQAKNSVYMSPNKQVQQACESLSKDPLLLKYGFNAIGHSQGGLLMRALVQRCNLTVHNLVTFGSPHQGTYGIPQCSEMPKRFLGLPVPSEKKINKIVNKLVKLRLVQNNICPASYWHDVKVKSYEKNNNFLADVNNARSHEKSATYKSKLMKLKKFVMVKFERDEMINPPESAWFEFFGDADNKTIPLRESVLYKADHLGLQQMNENKQLVFKAINAGHLVCSKGEFLDVMNELLNPPVQVTKDEYAIYYDKAQAVVSELVEEFKKLKREEFKEEKLELFKKLKQAESGPEEATWELAELIKKQLNTLEQIEQQQLEQIEQLKTI